MESLKTDIHNTIKEIINPLSYKEKLLYSVKQSFDLRDKRYIFGHKDEARGIDKLKILHGVIGELLSKELNNKISIFGYGMPSKNLNGKIIDFGKELSLNGYFNSLKGDVSVALYDNKTLSYKAFGSILTKSTNANFSQNRKNYFNNLVAETLDLRKTGNIVGQLFVVLKNCKNYYRNGEVKNIENINFNIIKPYIKLYKETINNMERPDALCLLVVKYENDGSLSLVNHNEFIFDEDSDIKIYNEISDFNKFIKDFGNLCNQKLSQMV